MLLPKELDKLPDRVAELYAELENDIIRDMARRIVKTDFATDTAQWQLIQLERLSVTHDKVFDRLSKATGKSKKELVKMFNEAADTAFAREDKAYRKAGYKTVPLAENAQLQKIINAGLRKTNNLFENLTGTTANTASRQFENALDRAYMQITSGAFDYNTAIRTCIRDLAQKGMLSFAADNFIAFLQTLADKLTKVGDWFEEHPWIAEFLGTTAAILATVAASVGVVHKAIAIAQPILNAFLAFWSALNLKTILIVAAIAAVIAIIVLCVKHWDEIKEAAARAWDWIKEKWNAAGEWFRTNVTEPIQNFFTGLTVYWAR